MLQAIQKFFEARIAPAADESSDVSEHAYKLATAALLIEMTRADYEVQDAERRAVADVVRRTFDLTREETQELIRLAKMEADNSTSLYEFTSLINTHFSLAQKEHVVELLWQVAFADGKLDKYEEHLVRKIAELIYVPHRSFIQAKHKVQESLGLG